MRHRTKVLQKTGPLELKRTTNQKTKRVHYTVTVTGYQADLPNVRNHFDPHHVRGGRFAAAWKFRNREEAEKSILMALLKFDFSR